jgi:hypothetical protein
MRYVSSAQAVGRTVGCALVTASREGGAAVRREREAPEWVPSVYPVGGCNVHRHRRTQTYADRHIDAAQIQVRVPQYVSR